MSQKPGKRRPLSQNRTNSRGLSARDQQDTLFTSHLEGVYLNPLIVHSLTSLIGCVVHVHLQNGILYEGILKAISPSMDIALQVAHEKNKLLFEENIEHLMELKFADIVTISATAENNQSLSTKDNVFKTDVEISHSNGVTVERELERFTEFVSYEEQSLNLGDTSLSSLGWSVDEMFSVNKEKFQVASSYDEEMTQYTTKLDRSNTDEYKQREVRAAKLAGEIETRDKFESIIDDTGTEEEMFSSVVRNNMVHTPSYQQDTKCKKAGEVLATSGKPLPSDVNYETVESVSVPVSEKFDNSTMVSSNCEQVEEAPSGSMQASKPDMDPKSIAVVENCFSDKRKDYTSIDKSPTDDADNQCESVLQEQVTDSKDEASTTEEKEVLDRSIRKFKLDPTAREFNPLSSSSTPTGAAAVTCSSLTVVSPSVLGTPSTIPLSGSGKKTKGAYRHKIHNYGYQSQLSSPSTTGGGYIISQSSPGLPEVVRPMHQVPNLTGQVLYTSVPQFNSFLPSQPGIVTPQVVSTPKFAGPPHQVIGHQLPHATLNQQSSLLAHHHLLTGVSPQIMSTSQSLFPSPHHTQMINAAMQDGLGSTTTVTSGPQRFDSLAIQSTGGLVHPAQLQAGQSYTPVVASQNKIIFPPPYNMNVNIGK